MGEEKIRIFLEGIKSQGKASPAGMYWNDFFLFLKKHQLPGEAPPVPLILASSGEPPVSKHHRLLQQLEWARGHHILDQAIVYLKELKDQDWETCSASRWNTDTYWKPD